MMFPSRKTFANKYIHHLSYRPPFELSGELVSDIRNGKYAFFQPLVVVDVGAAQSLDPRWEAFGESCVQIGFEPDSQECARLRKRYADQPTGTTGKILEPLALWHSKDTRTLNVTRDPDASSFYEPNGAFFERLPDPTLQQVVDRIPVPAIPLDSYDLPINGTIDVIKLDVQGAELDVMQGAQRHLNDGVVAVVAEILFTPHYINQPWFGDFDAFMRERGYQVFDIDLRRWRRRVLPHAFEGVRVGGISYGDVLYFKDPIAMSKRGWPLILDSSRFCKEGLEHDKLFKLVALAEFFSIPDYGLEILEHGVSKGLFKSEEYEALCHRINANTIVAWSDRNAMPL